MNEDLLKRMNKLKDTFRGKDQEKRNEFEMKKGVATRAEKEQIINEIKNIDAMFYEVKKDINEYQEKATEFNNGKMSETEFVTYEEGLARKYHFTIVRKEEQEEKQEVVAVKKPKNKLTRWIAAILAAAVLVTGGMHIERRRNRAAEQSRANTYVEETMESPMPTEGLVEVTPEPTPVATPVPTPTPTPVATPAPTPTPEVEQAIEEVVAELPFEEYGNFTDVNDEAQLRRRAEWYYNTFIADPNKPSHAGANFFTVEQIMQDMRMINGEFMLNDDGTVQYNDTDMIAVANDLHTIANYDSFKQYGTQIYFTPMAPLFEDGSLAQQGALQLDEAMERVVAAIRANDDEAFLKAAVEWGIIVINQFNYIDFTGEYVNIYQVDAPTSFALYHAMSAKYASTILEYSESHHLNVCIPYCIDYETGEEVQEALSQIMYNINERAIDAVAVRSGNQAEYEANNLSLPERLFLLAKDYFNSKYDIEHGCSKTLK